MQDTRIGEWTYTLIDTTTMLLQGNLQLMSIFQTIAFMSAKDPDTNMYHPRDVQKLLDAMQVSPSCPEARVVIYAFWRFGPKRCMHGWKPGPKRGVTTI